MIFKNLLRRKTRTLLTVLGISVGVSAIVALGAMADAFDDAYSTLLAGSKADFVLSQPDAVELGYSSVDEEVGDELLDMPEVREVSGMLEGFAQSEDAYIIFVFGYPEDSFVLDRYTITEGVSIFDRKAATGRGTPIMIGSATAESLKKEIGESIRIGSSVYRIVGIYQTGDAFEDGGVVLSMLEAQELLGRPRISSIFYIQVHEDADTERLRERVERKWPDLYLGTTEELADKQVMGDYMKGFVWVMAGLAIILGGVGMTNAQIMAVYERTREIGVLRAVGWTRRQVMLMILGETIVVSLLGGLLGIAFGFLMLYAARDFMALIGTNVVNVRPTLILQAFVVVFILGVVGGISPARRAARLQPIEAIRYEGGSTGADVKRLPFGGMAVQSLWQRTTRTILTMTVIGITVGAIMALDAYVRGVMDQFTAMSIGDDAQIMIRQAGISDTSTSAIDERVGAMIAAMDEVERVSGMIFTASMMPEGGGFFIVQGMNPKEYAMSQFNIVEGQAITNNRQVMLGRQMSESLNIGVGEYLELSGSRYKVVGIYESSVGWEELGGVMTLRDGQAFTGRPRKVTIYSVKVKNPSKAAEVVDRINERYPELHAALSGDFVDQMPDMEASDAMMSSMSFMAVLVGGLGVLNTMLMAVLERTREIGVLRAIGWRRRAILQMILKEALLLAGLGGVLGILIAFGLGFVMEHIPMYGELASTKWEFTLFIRAFITAFSLGLLGGIYPALRATNLQPIEALRYE